MVVQLLSGVPSMTVDSVLQTQMADYTLGRDEPSGQQALYLVKPLSH
jgi:hypothetical protein